MENECVRGRCELGFNLQKLECKEKGEMKKKLIILVIHMTVVILC